MRHPKQMANDDIMIMRFGAHDGLAFSSLLPPEG